MEPIGDDARLVLGVTPASGHESIPKVTLLGTTDGLLWLAQHIMRIAHGEPDQWADFHEEASGPLFQSAGWTLTIAKFEELRGAPPG